jgi:para-nitrobenzyl esterase
MQQPVFADMVFRSDGMDEDCLDLNVWTPARGGGDGLPVLVYAYGGGFIAGDGSEPRYDGESMACLGIVVVTFNYRLGVFGFLAHAQLSRETAGHGSGNYGFLDQLAALRWVRANIAAFGGDPARVTLAGESAGSISVSAQMASPLARDLIAGAIGESGSLLGTLPVVPLRDAEQNGARFAQQAGARSVAALRRLSADRLLALAGNPLRPPPGAAAFRFPGTVDGSFLPRPPAEIYAAGAQAHVPLLAGSNSAEQQADAVLGSRPPTVGGYRSALQQQFGAQADAVFRAYPAATDGAAVLDAAQDLGGDLFIGFSTWKWLELATRTGGRPTFYYYFSRPRPPLARASAQPPQRPAAATGPTAGAGPTAAPAAAPAPRGAVHSAEIEYALGNLDANPVYAWDAEDRRISRVMQGYFANFVKTGDPNGAGLPEWPRFASGRRQTIDASTHASEETVRARYELLERLTTRREQR